jgi:hypothetical protein
MTEFKVWRIIVDWVEDQGGTVYAACPPGSSVFDYDKFCIIDPISKKRDEPDILFSIGNNLYIVECKPTLSRILGKGKKYRNDESDVDKLHRIKKIYENGHYDQQLFDNYGITAKYYEMKIGIGYAATIRQPTYDCNDIIKFEIDSNCKVKIVGT